MKRKATTQIEEKYLRAAMLKAQRGAVSTQDIVECFLDLELYERVYHGLGSAKKPRAVKLSADEVSNISFALTAMANSFLDVAKYVPKQRPRKHERNVK